MIEPSEKQRRDLLIFRTNSRSIFNILTTKPPIISEDRRKAHRCTLDGRVNLTIVNYVMITGYYEASRRKLLVNAMDVIRFCKTQIPTIPQGNLPKERTDGEILFKVIGIDHAGPIYYKGNGRVVSNRLHLQFDSRVALNGFTRYEL